MVGCSCARSLPGTLQLTGRENPRQAVHLGSLRGIKRFEPFLTPAWQADRIESVHSKYLPFVDSTDHREQKSVIALLLSSHTAELT